MSGRKKVRPGRIELSADGRRLDVHYESMEVVVLPSGQEAVQSSKPGVKQIKLELPEDGDLQQAAQEIVAGCKLLHVQRIPEVEQLLVEAAERQAAAYEASVAAQQQDPQQQGEAAQPEEPPLEALQRVSELDRALLRAQQQQYLAAAAASATQVLAAAAATASLEQLEEYLEALYEEDMGVKAAAAAAISQLFRSSSALGLLQGHPTLLQALARLLREDAKHSAELCISLLTVFCALSHLPSAQALLVQNQVGSFTMELLDLELRRAEHWQQREVVAVADVGAKLLAGAPLSPREARLAGALARQEPLLYVGLSLLLNMAEADVGVEVKMVKKGLLSLLVVLLDRGSPQLLLLATTFLRRLSLFADNCRQLRESEVVGLLAKMVQPQAASLGGGTVGQQEQVLRALLSSVLRLLHNLSFDEGMQQQMVAAGLITKAVELLKAEAPGAAGRNSSSSGSRDGGSDAGDRRPGTAAAAQWRQSQQQQGRGVAAAGGPPLRTLALGLLYHLSLQDRHRSMFLYTDAPSTLHALLMAADLPLASSSPELAALLVSLAGSMRVAEEMARGGRLEQLLELVVGPAELAPLPLLPSQGPAGEDLAAAVQQPQEAAPTSEAATASAAGAVVGGRGASDQLLWKLLRAMAEHNSEPLRARFGPALHRIACLLMSGRLPGPAFLEALGCLARLDVLGHDYSLLLRSTGLHTFLADLTACCTGAGSSCGSSSGGSIPSGLIADPDAVLLEVVEAVGVLCADEACAGMLAAAGLVDALHLLMLERMEDDLFVLATTATAARMLVQPASQGALLAHPEVAARFAELLQHPSPEIQRAADAALDAVAASSDEWAASVRRLKFEMHNAAWLKVVHALAPEGHAAAAAAEGGLEAEEQPQRKFDAAGHTEAYWAADAVLV